MAALIGRNKDNRRSRRSVPYVRHGAPRTGGEAMGVGIDTEDASEHMNIFRVADLVAVRTSNLSFDGEYPKGFDPSLPAEAVAYIEFTRGTICATVVSNNSLEEKGDPIPAIFNTEGYVSDGLW